MNSSGLLCVNAEHMCVHVCVCKRGQTEGAAAQRGKDAPGKGRPVTQLSRNLGRMVTSPPGWVWDGGEGYRQLLSPAWRAMP